MVKREFQDLSIDFWVHPRKLGTAQPSLCLFHDRLDVGAELLDALRELANSAAPVQRALTFKACSRQHSLRKLKFAVVPERDDLKVMNIRRESETAIIEMTCYGLALVTEAFTSWLTGAEDFGVSSNRSSLKAKEMGRLDRESGELWFWGPYYYAP